MPLLKMGNNSSVAIVGCRHAQNVTSSTTMDLAVKCTMLRDMEKGNLKNGCDRIQLKGSGAPIPNVKHQLKKWRDVTMCTALNAKLAYAGSAWNIFLLMASNSAMHTYVKFMVGLSKEKFQDRTQTLIKPRIRQVLFCIAYCVCNHYQKSI